MDTNKAEVWAPGPMRFALEPRFIPRPDAQAEDDGWLICQLFDSEHIHSEIVILDAQQLAKGPVAVLRLRNPVPSALHSCWSDTYYGPEGIPPKQSVNVVPFSSGLKTGDSGLQEKESSAAA